MNKILPFSLHTLIFHVTKACNLKCSHCWQRSEPKGSDNKVIEEHEDISSLKYADILNTAKGLGLKCVKFTGGEPFLHPEVWDYLDITNKNDLSIIIETNGTLLDKIQIKRLKALNRLELSVSLDGTTPLTHDRFRGVDGAYNLTISALELLAQFEIPVQIIMCLYRENMDELDELLRIADDFKVKSVKINPIQPIGRGQDFIDKEGYLSICELLDISDELKKGRRQDFSGDIHFSLPLAFKPLSEIIDKKYSLCRIFHILGLLPNGYISFCGIGNIEQSAIIGNIFSDRIDDLWQNAPLLLELRKRLPSKLKGICSYCIFKAVCLGECRASAYNMTGDLMAPFWICQKAYEEGLFPQSRLNMSQGKPGDIC
ncbi:MAG: radical SAM protein [Thermodesulfobacteriota bacterium]|nr:radical SAM protein [Thermodesulfobacteriota bacterium]